MNKSLGRVVTFQIVCLLLCISILSSCTERNAITLNSKKYVEEGSVWWEDTSFCAVPSELMTENLPLDCFYQLESVYCEKEKMYTLYSGISLDNGNYYNSWVLGSCSLENTDFSFNKIIDLSKILNDSDSWIIDVLGYVDYQDRLCVAIKKQFSNQKGDSLYLYEVNFENSKLTCIESYDFNDNSSDIVDVDSICSNNDSLFVVAHTMNSYNEIDYSFYAIDGDTVIKNDLKNVDFLRDGLAVVSDNTVVISVVISNECYFLIYDETGNFIKSECCDLEVSLCQDGCFSLENRVIYAYDNTMSKKEVLNLCNTNMDYNDSFLCCILSVQEDRVIVRNGDFITVLTRNEVNPNIGKQIVEIAYFEEVTHMESLGIKSFNSLSNDYFAVFTGKYCYWNSVDDSNLSSAEEYTFLINKAKTEVISQLKQDIDLGMGPDLLLGFSSMFELQNEEYLINLKDYYNSGNLFSEGEYFDSVINAAFISDGLFSIPLSYSMVGLVVNENDCKQNGAGISIGEYETFVANSLNGIDPLYCYDNKYDYFNRLLSCSYDLFVNEKGEYNFDCEAFREISTYVYENVPEHINNTYSGSIYVGSISGAIETYGVLVNKELLGLPTYDSRGPQFVFLESVSIPKCSSCIDGDISVIDILLSEGIQDYSINPVCKASFMKNARNPYDSSKLNETVINKYISFIDAGTNCYYVDYAVLVIIDEEIQSYFSGQKKLDDVINVINGRVNIYVNERT